MHIELKQKIRTFLMFAGNAEEAVTFYTSTFKHSRIQEITRYDSDSPGKNGSVKRALFTLYGQEYMAVDSPVTHAFGFTPAISLFIQGDTDEEVEELFSELSAGGQVLMPLGTYPFSHKFAWVTDRFGVSWQLSR